METIAVIAVIGVLVVVALLCHGMLSGLGRTAQSVQPYRVFKSPPYLIVFLLPDKSRVTVPLDYAPDFKKMDFVEIEGVVYQYISYHQTIEEDRLAYLVHLGATKVKF